MKYKDLSEQFPKLLEDSIKKLTLTLERDSKVLTEMNNSLNWIVTLMGVILATGISYFKEAKIDGLVFQLLYASRISFCATVFILIAHKITLLKYERVKLQYLNTLNTHELELKYDIDLLKKKINLDEIFSISTFINNFRNGEFIPLANDERKIGLSKMDRKITCYGYILKFTFWLSIIIFILNFISIFYLILV